MDFWFIKEYLKKKNYWAANLHTRMISEGSCNTEDWSNNAENLALHHTNK